MLEEIDKLAELNDLSEYMNDPDIDETLDLIIKLIEKPDIAPQKAAILVIKLQAISAKFGLKASYFVNIKKGKAGTEHGVKKNIYFSAHQAINELVQALKITART